MTIAIVLGIIVLGITIYVGYQRNKTLKAEEKIIDRNIRFIEEGEEFTLLISDKNIVTQKIKNLPYNDIGVSMNGNSDKQIFNFSSTYFTAQLSLKESSSDKSVYAFSFTGWRERNGVAVELLKMNMLLTAIEKAFLSIDPNTQVRTWKIDFNTKTSIF